MSDKGQLLSMFDDVTAHWWGIGTTNAEEIDRSAKMALDASGQPQGVHRHTEDEHCVRGGGCYVLRLPETSER